MKSNERLLELIGDIGDRYITENEPKKVKKSRRSLYIALGAASAAVLLLVFLPMTGITVNITKNGIIVYISEKDKYLHDPAPKLLPQYTAGTQYDTVSGSDMLAEPSEASASGSDKLPAATTADTTNPAVTTVPPTGLTRVEINYDDLPFEYNTTEKLEALNAGTPYSGGMGFEGMDAISWQDLIGNNPWRSDIVFSELPVFKGTGTPPLIDPDKGIAKLEKIAAALGEELTDVQYSVLSPEIFAPEKREQVTGKTCEITAKAGSASLSIYGEDLALNINIPDAEVPEWWENDIFSIGMSEKTARYLADKYTDVLGYDDYSLDTMDYGYINTQVFENSDDIFEKILYYNFRRARLRFAETPAGSGKMSVEMNIYDSLDMMECLGFYPVIDQFTAREMLLSGDYVTTVPEEMLLPDGMTAEKVMGVELIYKANQDRSFIMPYYRFIVEIELDSQAEEGMKHYGGFYVPAVSPEYLTDVETNVRFN